MVKEAVRIGNALKTALSIAELYDHIDDSGTSNQDSCVVEFENTNETFIKIIDEISGGSLIKYQKKNYFVRIICDGQGFKRTKKAEVVCEYLQSHGIKARVEYDLD